jgi:hypothetical protein
MTATAYLKMTPRIWTWFALSLAILVALVAVTVAVGVGHSQAYNEGHRWAATYQDNSLHLAYAVQSEGSAAAWCQDWASGYGLTGSAWSGWASGCTDETNAILGSAS